MDSLIEELQIFARKVNRDHVSAYAAQAAYFILVTIFPFLLLLMTLVPYLPFGEEDIINVLLTFVPGSFEGMVLRIVDEVYAKSLAVVPVTALLALWSAGKGIQALNNGLNNIYNIKETRGYLSTRLRAILYTVIFIFAIIMTLVLLVFGNSIQLRITEHFPELTGLMTAIISIRTSGSLLVLTTVFSLMYTFIPNRKATIKSQLPGAIFTATAWSVFSFFFSLYFDLSDGVGDMYGSMTGILLALLWMYICMYLVMLGAEFNYLIEANFCLTDE